MNVWETILAVGIGISLSAACGFRVFVPLLVMSIASKAGHLTLAGGFEWIASWPAIIAFGVATALEIAAYFIPWLDNLLDTIATPAAAVAGIIVTAACVDGMSPLLKWSLAVVAGGGAALGVQVLTVSTRAVSSASTGGVGNLLVSTVEGTASTVLSLLAVLLPILAIGATVLVILLLVAIMRRLRRGRRAHPSEAAAV